MDMRSLWNRDPLAVTEWGEQSIQTFNNNIWKNALYRVLHYINRKRTWNHTWLLGVIGLDTAHVRRLLGHQDLHEFRQTGFELGGCLEGQTQRYDGWEVVSRG